MADLSERHRKQIKTSTATIDVIVEGRGPVIIVLPSLGRASDDYDDFAAALAERGYTVLRPQPRGLGGSRGPMSDITLEDLADDVAAIIEHTGGEPAVLLGHAFGNWIARMTASRHPALTRGVVIAAAASRQYPKELTANIQRIVDPALPEDERLRYLRETFFAPGNDASVWLDGWHKDVRDSQFAAHVATDQGLWWSGGVAPILDLQAAQDPFRPASKREEIRDELGDRVTIVVVENASHALIPEQPAAVVEAVEKWIDTLPNQ